jgi:RND family efflux transporter MFP subunit
MHTDYLSISAWRLALALVAAGTALFASHAHADAQPVVAVQTVHVQRATIGQPVRGYGIVAASASNLTTVNLPYVARLTELRVQPGQSVARGSPLAIVEADPAAVLAAAQAKSAATLAQGELTRTQSLYDKGLATQSQLATAAKALQDARQALAAQQQMGVAAGPRPLASPIDGVVLQVSVAQGDQIQPGAAIMQLAAATGGNDTRANVMLGVEPSDAIAIHRGDTVTLHGLSTALAGIRATGRVVLVGASIDQQSQLVDVGANVPVGQTAYIPGTRVAADITTNAGVHWVVPRAAVLKDEHGEYVFQITAHNTAHRVAVITKVEDDGRYGVDGALDAAWPLVVSGNYELKDGMAVKATGSAAR